MFFTPDQYFYTQPQRKQQRPQRAPQWPMNHEQAFSGFNEGPASYFAPRESAQFFQNGPRPTPRSTTVYHPGLGRNVVINLNDDDGSDDETQYEHPVYASRRRPQPQSRQKFYVSSPWGDYLVDDDELQALRAYRESKVREAELNQRRQEAALRQQEAQRKAKQQALKLEQERRVRIAAEANARAAARDYIRRKREEQAARMQAEYEEKKNRQQAVLEKLFGPEQWSNFPQVLMECGIPVVSVSQKDEQNEQNDKDEQNEHQTNESAKSTAQPEELTEEQEKERAREYIKLLVDSLAPSVRVEFSDDESHSGAEEEEEDGPQCETASESSDSTPELADSLVDTLSKPPVVSLPNEVVSEEEQQDEDQVEPTVIEPVTIPIATESISRSPKHKRSKRTSNPRKARRFSTESSKTPSEIITLLKQWSAELDHIKEAESIFSQRSMPQTTAEITEQKRKVRSWYASTEKIYNKLDELKVEKDARKFKHSLTSDAVSMADKLEIWLLRLDSLKPVSTSPKYHVTLEDVSDDESN